MKNIKTLFFITVFCIGLSAEEFRGLKQILGVQQPHALKPYQINSKLHGKTPTQEWAAKHIVNELGADTIKVAMEKKHLLLQGFSVNGNPSLSELAEHEIYKSILKLPYKVSFFWAHGKLPFEYYTEDKKEEVYKEFYDFTKYLLTKYSGSGKTFMIGNWEGDWVLGAEKVGAETGHCTDENIAKMISWMNIRGKAVEDAKKATLHHKVDVFFYIEINHVHVAQNKGLKRMVNSVLPKTKFTDYVSVSAYDIQGIGIWKQPRNNESLKALSFKYLDYVESLLSPRLIKGKRVGIGEIGYSLSHIKEYYKVKDKTAEIIQAHLALENALANLEWGTPFWLWWALHDTDETEGKDKYMGFGILDQKTSKKRRLWHELKDYNKWAISHQKKSLEKGKILSQNEFREAAIIWLQSRVSSLKREIENL